MTGLFPVEERERVRDALVAMGETDERIVAAAAVGSSATGEDRWSDIDLTLGVADDIDVATVLVEWTHTVQDAFNAAVLFDLPFRSSIYRVFLLPGALQVDLSFTPARDFGANGPRFRLLFGEATHHDEASSPPEREVVGLAVHHVVRARFCLERGKLWAAEFWIHILRDDMLGLLCRRAGLSSNHARGTDALPPEVLALWGEVLVREIDEAGIRRALTAAVRCLVRDAGSSLDRTPWLRRELEALATQS
jgi:hypothetical protein